MLSSTIIDEIIQTTSTTKDVQVAFFFFDFNDPAKQTVNGMLRSLVLQLAISVEAIPQALEDLYAQHHEDRRLATQPTIKEWMSILLQLLNGREQFYVVIDALDECVEDDLLADTIASLVFQSGKSIRWLFTRRTSEQTLSSLLSANIENVRIEPSAVDRDIATYLNATLENDPRLQTFTSKAKTMIRSEIQGKARGMFVTNEIMKLG